MKINKKRKSKKIQNKTKQRKQRGRRKSKRNFEHFLRFLGINAAGLASKIMTFKKVVNELSPAVFLIEETKFKNEGKLKIENYHIFERIRRNRDGGGLVLGCLK